MISSGVREADRIRQVDGRGACRDHLLDDAAQEVEVAARGVLRRELHVVGLLARVADGVDGRVEALLARDAQLRLQVQVGGRNERVDAAARGGLNRPGGLLEIGAVAAGQARDHGPADLGRDAAHRFGVGGRGNREAGLDDVDTKGVELTGELQLLGRAQRKSRAPVRRRAASCRRSVPGCSPIGSLPGGASRRDWRRYCQNDNYSA